MSFGLHACTDSRSTVCRRMAAAHQGTMLVSACTAASSVIWKPPHLHDAQGFTYDELRSPALCR